MDQINAMIMDYLGPMGWLFIAGFLGVLLVLVALPAVLMQKKDPLSKLRDQARPDGMSPEAERALRVGGKNEKLDKFAQFLEPQDQEEFSQIQLTLLRAGYRSKGAVQTFHFAQFALGMGFLALGVIYTLIAPDASTQKTVLTVLIPGAVGYYLPKYWVTKRVQKREEEITEGFPDALDLMLVCVEAGQSLDQAIIRVAKEIRASFVAGRRVGDRRLRDEGRQGQDQGAQGFRRTLRGAGRQQLRHRADPVGDLRHLDRRGAARLCRGNARQARDARRGESQ